MSTSFAPPRACLAIPLHGTDNRYALVWAASNLRTHLEYRTMIHVPVDLVCLPSGQSPSACGQPVEVGIYLRPAQAAELVRSFGYDQGHIDLKMEEGSMTAHGEVVSCGALLRTVDVPLNDLQHISPTF
jgi:hypothetical protein